MDLLFSAVFFAAIIGFPVVVIMMNYLAHQETKQSPSVASASFEHELHAPVERSSRREVLHAPAQS